MFRNLDWPLLLLPNEVCPESDTIPTDPKNSPDHCLQRHRVQTSLVADGILWDEAAGIGVVVAVAKVVNIVAFVLPCLEIAFRTIIIISWIWEDVAKGIIGIADQALVWDQDREGPAAGGIVSDIQKKMLIKANYKSQFEKSAGNLSKLARSDIFHCLWLW